MADSLSNFVWYELITPDPSGAKSFYDSVVGWSVDSAGVDGSVDYRMIKRSDGSNAGGLLRLSDEMRQHGARPVWLGYIGVEDVDAAVSALEADGSKVMMPAWDTPYGRIAMITDPQGAPVYVMTPIPPEGEEGKEPDAFTVDRPQTIRWNELSTTDPDAAVSLYTRHFGWRQEGQMDMGELGQYRFLYRGETMIGAIMPKMPEMPVSLWTFFIGVDDIDRAASAVTAGGGTLMMEPCEIPGGEYSLNGIDPQGAAFGLVGPRNAPGDGK